MPIDLELASVADALMRTPVVLRTRLSGVPDRVLEQPLDGAWSPKDVVAHLVDVEAVVFRARIRRMLEEETPRFQSIDPSQRLRDGQYQRRTVDELLSELEELRTQSKAFIGALPTDGLDRSAAMDGTPEALTVRSLLHYWEYHDHNHLGQLCAMLCTALAPSVPDGWATQ